MAPPPGAGSRPEPGVSASGSWACPVDRADDPLMEQPIQHRGRFLGVVGTLQDSRADRKLGCGGTVRLGCFVTPGTYVAPSWSSGRNGPCPRWTAARDGRSSTTVTSNTTVRRSRPSIGDTVRCAQNSTTV